MAIRIKLRDGREALVQATMSQWQEALNTAIHRQQRLQIEQPDGSVVIVNPQDVESFREDPAAAADLAGHFHQAATG